MGRPELVSLFKRTGVIDDEHNYAWMAQYSFQEAYVLLTYPIFDELKLALPVLRNLPGIFPVKKEEGSRWWGSLDVQRIPLTEMGD